MDWNISETRAGQIQIYLLIFCLEKPKERLINQKFLFSNLPITFWFLVFRCLLIFELIDLKLVSKRFQELVNCHVKFKRIFDLTNGMCDEVLWNKKIQENLSNFKEVIGAEFKGDLILQMYVKHDFSSIFNKVNLCQIFSHFAFCKRNCDSDTELCRMCSRVYPNCVTDEFHLFDEIIIDDRFSSKFKAFFLSQYCMYLDIKYLYHKFVD